METIFSRIRSLPKDNTRRLSATERMELNEVAAERGITARTDWRAESQALANEIAELRRTLAEAQAELERLRQPAEPHVSSAGPVVQFVELIRQSKE
jgi:molecular chaperone GrpE (heat shock protein)